MSARATRPERTEVVQADLTWTGEGLEPGVQVAIDSAGRIEAAGQLGRRVDRRLEGRALFPGFVSAHSHAFQRGLRGLGERFPRGAGSFWTWRDAMYGLVESLDAARFGALTRQAFHEMRDAGITTVGEFHYLHHGPLAEDHALDRLVLEAARAEEIRIVLLQTCYRRGGVDRPLEPTQRRFGTPTDDGFWEGVDRLIAAADPAMQAVGVAAHSLRAVALDDVARLHGESVRRDLVFHMHVEEQPREVEECVAVHGRPPMALLLDTLEIDSRFTAVHCTHTDTADLERLAAVGGSVCICPLTEANLGDGIPNLGSLRSSDGGLCLGTDSNARISMVEEMRWLEYGQRLKGQARGILTDRGDSARALLRIATLGGARSLGVDAGEIAPGRWADFVALDLSAPALAGSDAASIPAAWIFGGGSSAIAETCVGGRWRARGRDGALDA